LIDSAEITARSNDFGIHTSDVQRDYVFGWLLAGLYSASDLSGVLALKGGNAIRKGYLPSARFSADLDFATEQGLDAALLVAGFNQACEFASEQTGVRFDLGRTQVADEQSIDRSKRLFKLRLYFEDFFGQTSHLVLKVRADVTEYDRIYLPTQGRPLIHPYSDQGALATEIRCIALEEALADKLKCLLQRRYSYDLFDLAYGAFLTDEYEIDRSAVVRTFLRKTVFEPSPTAARNLLLGVPFDLMRGFWERLVAPKVSLLSFDRAVAVVKEGLRAMFAPFDYGALFEAAYFPAEIRNPLIEAASDFRLVRLTYDGVPRLVEPYSLAFKRRRDGVAQEYFYGWDQTGGRRSGPGIKAFLQGGVQGLEVTDETFQPRFEVELRRAGDRDSDRFLGQPFSAQQLGARSRLRAARPARSPRRSPRRRR